MNQASHLVCAQASALRPSAAEDKRALPGRMRIPRNLAACVAGLIILHASAASAQLLNGGFDESGGSLAAWTDFNNPSSNVSSKPITPRSSTHVAKIYGSYSDNPNYSGITQNRAASPGQQWTATCYARHNTGDTLLGSNILQMKIEFYSSQCGGYGSASFLAEHSVTVLRSSTSINTWRPHTLQAVAPSGTVEARIAFVFIQTNGAGGAGLVDDVNFTTTSDPPVFPGPSSGSSWRLLWHDEFDGTSIDLTKWRVEDRHLIKNNELQYYTPEDVSVGNGLLTLRSRERSFCGYDSNGNWGCWNYTSGLVESKGLFSHAFGWVEIRAKLPHTQGIWPAHWMMKTPCGWPPEIDITELLGHEPDTVYMTHHWRSWPYNQSDGNEFVGPDFSQDFHTFAIRWEPGRIDWLIDGVVRVTSTSNVPVDSFFLILNTAVGGDWPGNPDGTTVFPQTHEIDYVRWYLRTDPGDFDGDQDIDADDSTQFSACFTGADVTPYSPECPAGDFDLDNDVDCVDWDLFQQAWTGPPAAPALFLPCETPDVPTLPQWGLVAMALMVLTAGSLVITRRRNAES